MVKRKRQSTELSLGSDLCPRCNQAIRSRRLIAVIVLDGFEHGGTM
jgi:hypothetical protein